MVRLPIATVIYLSFIVHITRTRDVTGIDDVTPHRDHGINRMNVEGGSYGRRYGVEEVDPLGADPEGAAGCSRAARGLGRKSPGDNGYRISLAGRPQPEGYTAGQVYTGERITLHVINWLHACNTCICYIHGNN